MSQTEKKRKWPVLFVPPVLYILSWKLVHVALKKELADFYAVPDRPAGFPIPLMTIILLMGLLVVCVGVTIFTLVVFFQKPKQD